MDTPNRELTSVTFRAAVADNAKWAIYMPIAGVSSKTAFLSYAANGVANSGMDAVSVISDIAQARHLPLQDVLSAIICDYAARHIVRSSTSELHTCPEFQVEEGALVQGDNLLRSLVGIYQGAT
ncbi:MAG: hypothetical protein GY832_22225 [Chloroflexi bacterium]|nr:hypothetical protein [Chloroflexota bacterium]